MRGVVTTQDSAVPNWITFGSEPILVPNRRTTDLEWICYVLNKRKAYPHQFRMGSKQI